MSAPARSPERNSRLSPKDKAQMLALLVDELIPGAEDFPSASAAGVHGILAMRLFSDLGSTLAETVADRLGFADGDLASGDPEARIRAVSAFEAADPDLFDRIYTAAVIAYYETPFVIEAIQQTGRPYSARPHVTGYPMAPFDFGRDTPTHGRGAYLRTDEVRRVDISGLDLDTKTTTRWGLER
ncbi:hypothetical protein [Ensifer soli]|uniref:hypothetical protein n=1 Tax=Ciceribacter sp. sgz301302 TaxID=3342379 RepID=UPI0035BA514E